ncbi:alkaline exonuclease [Peridroma alphabaculovirus]|uniref:Alkaline exonuclease n=1 Tax=Peridroma alphabaculovirus TaxID=1346829 RepID=A0A068LKF9_9ABAC|nr:alkaline exonuclease [Peridroma alphabaculovirus]AIE47767.1 alkaline exonuclease [Peridroma alphabaculovirus]
MGGCQLNAAQSAIFKKYCYSNFVVSLESSKWRMPRDEIMAIEVATRMQSENPLWGMLRLDRQTASGNASAARVVPQSTAMSYGLAQEKEVKSDRFLVAHIKATVEATLNTRVVDTVLECGMFLSQFGLYGASPDAYLLTENDVCVPVEIKCPLTYRDMDIEAVRRTFNTRKLRYRIKHTAFSVNKTGAPVFEVERCDPHYRQMQRQMYVMNAPMCVYVVKFANSYVVSAVMRDEMFCLRELDGEKRLFEMFVHRNMARRRYRVAAQRKLSLMQNGCDAERAGALADNGLYFDFGQLVCVFCARTFDIESTVEHVLSRHDYCGESNDAAPVDIAALVHKDYMHHSKRVESLRANYSDPSLADGGVFHDGTNMQTFCCGQAVAAAESIKHTTDCAYNLLLSAC